MSYFIVRVFWAFYTLAHFCFEAQGKAYFQFFAGPMFQPEATPSGPSRSAQAQQPSPASPTFSHAPHMKPSCTAHVSFSLTRFVSLPPACMHACSSPSSPSTRCPHTTISCTTGIAWIICMWEQGRNGTVFPGMLQFAFEEVVGVDGYGGEFNPLVTFSTLDEKTTMMSPKVSVRAGIPCCRLVQNAGEFVVTFPRAYHSRFSHGFNFGEAANIATLEWLKVACTCSIFNYLHVRESMLSSLHAIWSLLNWRQHLKMFSLLKQQVLRSIYSRFMKWKWFQPSKKLRRISIRLPCHTRWHPHGLHSLCSIFEASKQWLTWHPPATFNAKSPVSTASLLSPSWLPHT